MHIFDAHMHIGGYGTPDPKGLTEKLEYAGVSGANLLSIDPEIPGFTYEERMDNLFAWVKGYEDRLFPVAWLHPFEDNILDKVRDCARRGVYGFKFIPSNFRVGDEQPMAVFRLIEELGFPILFHSGILYDFSPSSDLNRPSNWESFVNCGNLRFSLAHCSHPWYDEGLLVLGKFLWLEQQVEKTIRTGTGTYATHPWVQAHIARENGTAESCCPQMYMDTSRGAQKIYRRDLFRKLCSYYPDAEHIMFGTDLYTENYDPEITRSWLQEENALLDEFGASARFRENMYQNNFFRFMGIKNPYTR